MFFWTWKQNNAAVKVSFGWLRMVVFINNTGIAIKQKEVNDLHYGALNT